MQSLSYWEAWGRWWAGDSLAGTTMWGQQMLFWGRTGKLVQFAGGLVAVLDIVGSDRVEAWGRQLKERSVHTHRKTFAESRRQLSKTLWQLRLHERKSKRYSDENRHLHLDPRNPGDEAELLLYTTQPELTPETTGHSPSGADLSEDAQRANRYSIWAFLLLVVVVYGGLTLLTSWALLEHPWSGVDRPWWVVLVEVVVLMAVWFPAIFLITSLGGWLAVLLNLMSRAWPIVAYYLLVKPTLLLLRGSNTDRSLRVVGISLVVIGFSFDLLAT
ncbi:hypothetical protein [Lentzea sp. NEAU-D7]|uniref:hypothetical protein n=1 Tax=Lentzea sp. NEAU-D7 TaxID=2994667 RepID=UPI00224B24F6|nr:hypothetical protein [Lentzea sp. NEAU-D7]MCX2953141.1 hypothetical protein [Lentzea sp. NEAU-D7]